MKWLLPGIMLVVGTAHAEVYKWKDADGRVQFSDQPPPGVAVEAVKIRSFVGPAKVTPAPASATDARILMLSTDWCGVCKSARAYMKQKGIAFVEQDVEKSEAGRSEYRRLNGRGVPILLVGTQRMDGFSAERLEQMLRAP